MAAVNTIVIVNVGTFVVRFQGGETGGEGRQRGGGRAGGRAVAVSAHGAQLEVVRRLGGQAVQQVGGRVGLSGPAGRNRGPRVGELGAAGPEADLVADDSGARGRFVPGQLRLDASRLRHLEAGRRRRLGEGRGNRQDGAGSKQQRCGEVPARTPDDNSVRPGRPPRQRHLFCSAGRSRCGGIRAWSPDSGIHCASTPDRRLHDVPWPRSRGSLASTSSALRPPRAEETAPRNGHALDTRPRRALVFMRHGTTRTRRASSRRGRTDVRRGGAVWDQAMAGRPVPGAGTQSWHPASGIRHPASGIRHPASGIRHPASGIRHPASGIRHPALRDRYRPWDSPTTLPSAPPGSRFVLLRGRLHGNADALCAHLITRVIICIVF